ncbi:MAG: PAS domain S-box protein [Lentisphaerae bacterium]|jgi:PAS domain S-box-containing protein|nr:PAS domain S-box protein [Lentisphaerota bacterium]MBT5605686.1 PAS domain S-box protein [Lentisphaerota bacterium]MBT7844431.1 PAS domain S-box protein [Lentisphaerota bacterium]
MNESSQQPVSSPSAWRKNLTLIILILLILVIYIGALIAHNYFSHIRLHQEALLSMVSATEKRAASAAYFFGERRNDVRNLLSRREVTAYFEHKSLGMSLKYGLQISLNDVRGRLADFASGTVIRGERVYRRVVLLDSTGAVVGEVSGNGARPDPSEDLSLLVDPLHRTPHLIGRVNRRGQAEILVSAARHQRGQYAGQLVAWLSPRVVTDQVVNDVRSLRRFTFLLFGDSVVYEPDGTSNANQTRIYELGMGPPSRPRFFTQTFEDGTECPMVGLRVPIESTNFSLVKVVAETSVLGQNRPLEFPLAMGLLAVIILSAAGLVLRSRLQAVAMEARLDETSDQRRYLQSQNTQLEKEISDRRLLTTAVEQAAEAIIITDREGTIEYVNPAFEKVTGYPKAKALGGNNRMLQSGKHDRAFYEDLWDVLLSGGVWSGKFTNRRKDGTLYEEEAEISPVRNEAGQITNFVAVKRDVTAQIAMEDQLRQSQKMEAIGELAGGIAHDFNNLLTVILGNCNLLMLSDGGLAADAIENVEEITKAGNRATALTRQLLAFSRRQIVQLEVLDLCEVIRNTEKMLGRLIRENIAFEVNLPKHPLLIKADPVQVDQIIINLAVNARDAMPEGGELTLTVCEENVTPGDTTAPLGPGDYVVLELRDTGHGMSQETQARIFEPFFTTKGEGAGTGLGLATVYGIVKQNQGDIQVQSEVGKGTTFRLFLPRVSAAPATAVAQSSDNQPTSAVQLANENTTILVVDDEESILNMAKRVLVTCGYTVFTALTDHDVLATWDAHRDDIDLLLTDVIMPGMSGLEIGAKLRKDRPNLGVLCMSAYTDSTIMNLGATEPDMFFIQKPFTPPELLLKVQEVLNPSPS